jgi:Flp pilus assembly protein TadD
MIAWLEQNGDRILADDVALLRAEHAIAGMDLATATEALARVKEPARNICRLEAAKGWVAANSNALDDAVVAFGNAARNCPHDAGIWNLLGLVFIQKGEAAAAKEAFEQALAFAPDEPDVQNNLALALLQKGELELANQKLEMAARNAPDNRLILANLDFVSGMRGAPPKRRPQDSDTEWSLRLVDTAKGAKAASRTPQANALFSQALLTLDHFDEAIWSEIAISKESQP